jgi:hypothetical protein
MEYLLRARPEVFEEIRRIGPGRLIGPIQTFPTPGLRKLMDKLLERRSVVQLNDTTDILKAQWLTMCPVCKKGYLGISLSPDLFPQFACMIPDLAVFPSGPSETGSSNLGDGPAAGKEV